MKLTKSAKPAAPKRHEPKVGCGVPAAVVTPGSQDVAASRAPACRRITFRFRAETAAKVFVAGTFNGWDPSAQSLKPTATAPGLVQATLLLPPGRHEYKFVVNGTWQADPECPEWTLNSCGSLNSVIQV